MQWGGLPCCFGVQAEEGWPAPGNPRILLASWGTTCIILINRYPRTHKFLMWKKSLSGRYVSKVKIQRVCPKNYVLFAPCPPQGLGLVQTFIHFSVNTNPFLMEIFEEIFFLKIKKKKKGKRAQTNKQNYKQTTEFWGCCS